MSRLAEESYRSVEDVWGPEDGDVYEGFKLVPADRHPMVTVATLDGSPVPTKLRGIFTSRDWAKRAISGYISNLTKEKTNEQA